MQICAGQVAVITGGASGIGLALAECLGALGVKIMLADIEENALQHAVAALVTAGIDAVGQATDVSRADAVEQLRDRTLAQFGRADIVCNNAGVVSPYGNIWEAPVEDWDWVFGVNLWGVIHGIRSFVPILRAQGSGHVVNTASLAGIGIVPFNGVYNASKHAVVSITETLRAELDTEQGAVGATVVCPGLVATRIGQSDRNRPVRAQTHRAPHEQQVKPMPASAAANAPLAPENVAQQIVRAIETNQLYLATNPGSAAFVAARQARLSAETLSPLL